MDITRFDTNMDITRFALLYLFIHLRDRVVERRRVGGARLPRQQTAGVDAERQVEGPVVGVRHVAVRQRYDGLGTERVRHVRPLRVLAQVNCGPKTANTTCDVRTVLQ